MKISGSYKKISLHRPRHINREYTSLLMSCIFLYVSFAALENQQDIPQLPITMNCLNCKSLRFYYTCIVQDTQYSFYEIMIQNCDSSICHMPSSLFYKALVHNHKYMDSAFPLLPLRQSWSSSYHTGQWYRICLKHRHHSSYWRCILSSR